LLEGERAKTEIDLFLKSAAVQEKVAAGGAPHWAPVHQLSSTAQGAFYVTDRHEHSLQRLIDLRLKLNSTDLSVVVGAMIEGLMELKSSCGRPHGDLKAANVLIGGTGDISQRNVVLCDPLPDEYVDTSVHWDTDLLAVAEFIYQLVVHRPSPRLDGWQAPDSGEWHRLGKQATAWRNLCNRLFMGAAAAGTTTLETVAEDLAQIAQAKPTPRYRWPLAAAVIVIALAVVLFMLLKKPAPPEAVQWERLCQVYRDWFMVLYEYEGWEKRWRQEDEDLNQLADEIEAAGYLYRLEEDTGENIDVFVRKPDPSIASGKETRKALAAVEAITSFFDPNSSERWPLLTQLDQTASQFRGRQWEKPAVYLTLLAQSVEPGPSKPIAENVDTILGLRDTAILKEIEAQWGEVQDHAETIARSEDPVLGQFGDYVRSQLRSVPPADYSSNSRMLPFVSSELTQTVNDSLAELHDKLGGQDIGGLTGELAEFVTKTWPDPQKFDKDQFSKNHKQVPPGTLTAATFRDRLRTMGGYCVIPDMRGEFRASVANIKRLMPLATIANPKDADICARDFGEFESMPNFEKLANVEIKCIVKDQSDIEALLEEHMPRLQEIEDRVIATAEPVETYRDRIRKKDLAVEPQINAQWIILRNALLDSDKYRDIKQTNADYAGKYTDLRRKMEGTENSLVSLHQELQSTLPPQIGVELRPGWNDKIGQFYGRQRSEATERILARIPLREEIPNVNDPPFKSLCAAESTKLRTVQTDLGGIVTAFNTIEDRLNACYLYGEEFEPEVQGARTVGTLRDNWRDNHLLAELEIRDALKELTDRIENLEAVDKAFESRDPKGLVNIAADSNSRPEAVYAAWRQLAISDGSWPATAQNWQTEREIQESLAASLESLEADRVRKLRVILASESFNRHKRIIDKNTRNDPTLLKFSRLEPPDDASLSDLDKLEQLAEKLGEFAVDPDWQDGLYDTSTFAEPNGQDNTFTDDIDATDAAMRAWLKKVRRDYRVIADPRDPNLWEAKASELDEMIDEGLNDVQDANDSKLLEKDRTDLSRLKAQFESILKLPAITKHEARVNTWEELWGTNVPALEDQITSHIRPRYCRYLEISDGKVTFNADLGLSPFEPVAYNNPDFNSVSLSNLREFEKQEDSTLKTRFFDEPSLNEDDPQNFGWPKYIRFKSDPSLRLRFIPGDPTQGIPPFYMALHETTTAQYAKFLNAKNATGGDYGLEVTDSREQAIWAAYNPFHGVDEGRLRIAGNAGRFTPEQRFENHPAVWVTAEGAQEYAKWLDPNVARLPQASWHRYAATYNDATSWHVRGSAWAAAVDAWNSLLTQNPTAISQAPPLGAGDQEYCDTASDATRLATLQAIPKDIGQMRGSAERGTTYLPCPVLDSERARLCDLLGNVWEWCVTDAGSFTLCGGSCLSKPENTNERAELPLGDNQSNRDVGFRIVVVPPIQ